MNKEKGGYKYEGQVKTITKVNKGKSEEKKKHKGRMSPSCVQNLYCPKS